jgi:hypothetical protein
LALETGFVTAEESETVGVVAKSAEGESGASGRVMSRGIVFIHFSLEVGAFDSPEAEETPAADGHVLD